MIKRRKEFYPEGTLKWMPTGRPAADTGEQRTYLFKRINGRWVYQKKDKNDYIISPNSPIGKSGPRTELRTKLYGVGINDVMIPEFTTSKIWQRWQAIIRRTDKRDPKWLLTHPTYVDCTMDPKWYKLSAFKEWIETFKDHDNKEIDKDILIPGNLHYAPETCLMVRPIVNAWFKPSHVNGELPRGVCWCSMYKAGKTKQKPYRAQINALIREGNKVTAGPRTYLGKYDNAEEASFVFQQARKEQLHIIIDTEDDPRVKNALIKHMEYDELHTNYW